MPAPSKPYHLLLNGVEGAALTYIRGTNSVYQVQVSTGDGEVVSIASGVCTLELFTTSTRSDAPVYSRRVTPDGSLGAYGFGTVTLPSAFDIARSSYFIYLHVDDGTGTSGQVLSAPLTFAGAGYEVAPTATLVPNDGGTGATLTVAIAGPLKRIDVATLGAGYQAAPGVVVSAPPVGGVRATAVAVLDYADSAVSTVTVTAGGVNYSTPPAVAVSPGMGAVLTALMGVAPISLGGSSTGYTLVPTVVFSGGGGSGATAQARLAGAGMASFTVTAGGTGYTTATVTVSGAEGSGCTGTAVISSGVITGITLSATGSGYTGVPTVTITGDGAGATAIAVRTGTYIASITILSPGSGYTTIPTVTFSGGGSGAVDNTTRTVTLIVVSVTVVSGGAAVSSATPSISFSGGGGYSTSATATSTGGKLGTFSLSQAGSGYLTPPTVTLVGGAPSSPGTAVSRLNAVVTGLTVSAAGTAYQAGALVVFAGGSPSTAATATCSVGIGICRVADTPSTLLVT